MGNQSVVVVFDVRKQSTGSDYEVWTHNGKRQTGKLATDAIREAETLGAGEIVVNSIDNDGKMKGYDLALAKLREDGHAPSR